MPRIVPSQVVSFIEPRFSWAATGNDPNGMVNTRELVVLRQLALRLRAP